MTFFHILNFAIPVSSVVILGILVDRLSQPVKEKKGEKVVSLRK